MGLRAMRARNALLNANVTEVELHAQAEKGAKRLADDAYDRDDDDVDVDVDEASDTI